MAETSKEDYASKITLFPMMKTMKNYLKLDHDNFLWNPYLFIVHK
jgi:hypothetical protein